MAGGAKRSPWIKCNAALQVRTNRLQVSRIDLEWIKLVEIFQMLADRLCNGELMICFVSNRAILDIRRGSTAMQCASELDDLIFEGAKYLADFKSKCMCPGCLTQDRCYGELSPFLGFFQESTQRLRLTA